MIAIRGAIATVDNTAQAISGAGQKLIEAICQKNGLESNDLVMAQFSATEDLNAGYPAKGVRENGFAELPMMCFQEMKVEGSIQGCIRVIVFVSKDISVRHIYLGDAQKLRPDWVGDCIGK